MTEEIIIDGVDVSKYTRYVRNKYFSCCNIERCQDNPNCMLKKLKRAEQKLEKIKNVVTDGDSLIHDYQTAYDLAIDILQIIEGEENV